MEGRERIEYETMKDWLDALASDAPAPGGGAAAALNLAVGAALISMVCNLTIGKPRYAEHEETMIAALERAEALRLRALSLAGDDSAAFVAVSAAYKLPRDSDTDKQTRKAAIQDALGEAAIVPLRTAELAVEVIELAGRILDGSNVNVVSDVAVAASSARAALQAAVVNVEINLAAIDDPKHRSDLGNDLAQCGAPEAEVKADEIVRAVRERIAR